MSDTIRCPDCGHENPPGFNACAACGFPLTEAGASEGRQAESEATSTEGAEPQIYLRRHRPRPMRSSQQATALWLIFGSFAVVLLIVVAVRANLERAHQPVEGSTSQQQFNADSLFDELQKDSTDVAARVKLGDIFYDTGNWPDAIIHYRAAVRMDSSQVSALVDLGVCYYNLGHTEDAERYFMLALNREAEQPVALFNLGIVHERKKQHRQAMDFYHRALRTEPPEQIKQAIMEAMGRLQKELGLEARPLPGNTPRSTPPGGG